ncbi:MAG: hypothetical protein QOE45_326 [Frankiaceae bacterium]|nr:hypothetical protein [Frankiaceae bacterium]
MTGDSTVGGSNAEVVRALWRAHREGRIEDVLALVHREVVWEPLTPNRTLYVGRAGTRALFEDIRHALGDFRIDLDEVAELPDGRVVSRGHIVGLTPDGEVVGPPIATVATVQDGLIIGFASLDLRGPR